MTRRRDHRLSIDRTNGRLQVSGIELSIQSVSYHLAQCCVVRLQEASLQVSQIIRSYMIDGYPNDANLERLPAFKMDKSVLGAMVALLEQWLLIYEDPTKVNIPALDKYIENYLKDTRTKYMFRLLKLVPKLRFEPKYCEKMEKKFLSKMAAVSKVQPTETEIVYYPTMWNLIKEQVLS